jgi:exosortase/archaeosortase family protein
MEAADDKSNAPLLPLDFLAALAILAGFALFLVWDQWRWWSTKEDYAFGYLVPLFVGYVVWDRWPALHRRFRDTSAGCPPRWLRRVLALLAASGLILGGALFALGAFYRAGAGASQPGSLALAAGFAIGALSLVYLSAAGSSPLLASPADSRKSPWRAVGNSREVRIVALFVFPTLVWVISAPLVAALERSLSVFLLQKVTAVVFFVFDTLGFPLERQGNVLVLPRGEVGVAEACSGIRSLTGSIFAGSFLAAVFLPQAWKKGALIFAAVGLAYLTNIGRSLILTGVAYARGAGAIEGALHDVTGYAVLGVTFLGLLLLLRVFRGRGATGAAPTEANRRIE